MGDTESPAARDRASRAALILVLNTVTSDSRIWREARTLRDLGFDVTIAGVVSESEPERELDVNGFRLIRLAPVEALRRIRRRRRTRKASTVSSGASPSTASHPERGFPRNAVAVLRRLAITSAYYLQGTALVRRISPELVHANDYNTMWIGIAAKLLCRSRLVYDAHELWPDQGRSEWRPWQIACEWLFLRVADATVAANPGIAETLARRYRVPTPVVVRNVPEQMARPPSPPEGLRAGAAPLAMYVGGLAPERGIEEMIRALALVPDLRLRFMGAGSDEYRAELERVAAEARVGDRVEHRPPVEPSAVAETIAGADFGVVLTHPTCLNNVQSLPNKLFEYTVAGLPVVASDLPVISAIVRAEGIGEVVDPVDVEAIAGAMQALADPARNASVRARVRNFSDRVNWRTEKPLLEDVYAKVSPGSG
jgi:glycosyltransferase involved in cell wall biosynthesis